MTALRPLSSLSTPAKTGRLQPVRNFAAGAALFRETDPAPFVFQIVTGAVRLTRLLETGRRQVVAFSHPGDIVGFPDDGLHHSDCEALGPVTVLAHRAGLLSDPNTDPDVHRMLQGAALREIHGLQDHLLLMARKGARGKLASFLALLVDRHAAVRAGRMTVDLMMPRADIADYLCMSIETVSRMMTELRQAGIIALDGPHRLVVLDCAALTDVAAGE
ncbi:helix-turn-helix domain-containing protein [Jannaschia donghaensis]|uniref:Nitrogen fixation regulation protein FixK n=1 Tax=Jannaschia donghaensis TaxID=420998 RepID=A0A0M6YLF8_9RHOB|nr:helix-turn-helix domain-containing protein [Jannaschia donghaensis]CTQ50353.1 Nitrogen fixation regulation protein FixK [Jannaschia donghaensis]